MSLKQDEDEIKAKGTDTGPRVSLKDLEDFIEAKWTINGQDLERANIVGSGLRGLTLAIVTLKNGYVLIGHSAVVSLENYNQEIGERIAYESCLRQLWALLGFQKRTEIWQRQQVPASWPDNKPDNEESLSDAS